jgi:hypothetical protein
MFWSKRDKREIIPNIWRISMNISHHLQRTSLETLGEIFGILDLVVESLEKIPGVCDHDAESLEMILGYEDHDAESLEIPLCFT